MDRGYLLLGASASGFGVDSGNGAPLIQSAYNSMNGMWHWNRIGAGTASATVFGSPDPVVFGWFPITSLAITGSGSAIISANYGFMRASVFFTAANPTAYLHAQWASRY